MDWIIGLQCDAFLTEKVRRHKKNTATRRQLYSG